MTPRDEISLRQMLDHAKEASDLASARSRDDLDQDRAFSLAMTRLLEIIGEAAARVSQPTRDQHPRIEWLSIVGLRNRLIHGYDQVDHDILWQIVQHDLAMLIEELRKALGKI